MNRAGEDPTTNPQGADNWITENSNPQKLEIEVTADPEVGVLIASDGGLVGVLGAEGRILSRAKGSGFVAGAWLENDGDLADQKTAAGRSGFMA